MNTFPELRKMYQWWWYHRCKILVNQHVHNICLKLHPKSMFYYRKRLPVSRIRLSHRKRNLKLQNFWLCESDDLFHHLNIDREIIRTALQLSYEKHWNFFDVHCHYFRHNDRDFHRSYKKRLFQVGLKAILQRQLNQMFSGTISLVGK